MDPIGVANWVQGGKGKGKGDLHTSETAVALQVEPADRHLGLVRLMVVTVAPRSGSRLRRRSVATNNRDNVTRRLDAVFSLSASQHRSLGVALAADKALLAKLEHRPG